MPHAIHIVSAHLRLAAAFLLVATSSVCRANEPWPQWRGPNRDGQSTGAEWPGTLSDASLQRLWRVELGPSYSGPVLSDDLVFTTETRDERTEVVSAIDRRTGEVRWRSEWMGAMQVPPYAAANGSWIRATPAYDGERLYVAGMRHELVCLDARSGDEAWRVDFVEEFGFPLPSFGFVTSPLVQDGAVYTQAGDSVVKLDALTGRILWRALNDGDGDNDSAFASPVIATLAGERQLVVQTRQELAGLSLDSGQVLWRQVVPSYRGMNIQTPLIVDDSVFVSSYRNRSWLYRVSRRDGELGVATVWENNAQGYMSTPVKVDGYAYLQLQNGRFTCIDLSDGSRAWTSRPFGKYASLAARGDKILALVSDGRVVLLEADPQEFTVLGEAKVSDQETWAHVAVSGDEVYVRALNALSAFRWER